MVAVGDYRVSMTETMRVVIADSHEIVREGIAAHLQNSCDVEIVGQAEDGYGTLKVCRAETPDLLIMDLSLVRPSGMDTFTKLRRTLPDVGILVLSSDARPKNAFNIFSQGARGFMRKQSKSKEFVAAVNAIALGYTCFPHEYIREFVGLRQKIKRTGNIYGLSPREIEVLEAFCNGAKSAEVAENLSISVRTVETHRNAIYRKTECRDPLQLAEIAQELV